MRGRDRLDRRSRDDEDEDRSEVGERRPPSDAGPQRQPAGRGEGGGEPFERQLRHVGEEATRASGRARARRAARCRRAADDHQVAEPTRATLGWEAEEGEQERRGQDPGVGRRDRREVAEAPVQRRVRLAAGRQRRARLSPITAPRSVMIHRPAYASAIRTASACDRERVQLSTSVTRSAGAPQRQFCGAHSLTTHPDGGASDLRVDDVQRRRQTRRSRLCRSSALR